MSINRRTFLKWVTAGATSLAAGIGLSKVEAHHKSWHRAYPTPVQVATPTPAEIAFPTQQAGVVDVANGFTIGTLTLTKTYESIGVYLAYTNDDNVNASVVCEFKKASDSTWRNSLALWRIGGTPDDTFGRMFMGSILFCEPNTLYDIRITITDADGVTGTNPIISSITTSADNIPAASSLVATRFVNAVTGNDSWDGTAETFVSGSTGPWQTAEKALTSTPSGGVAEFAPGYYHVDVFERSSPITLKAKYAVITNSPEHGEDLTIESDTSKITFIDSGYTTAPTGSPASTPASPYSIAPWASESFTGPVLGGSHTGFYNWTSGLTNGITHLMYANSRDALVWTRVPVWDNTKSGTVNCSTGHAAHGTGFSFATNQATAEVIEVNGMYTSGGTWQAGAVTHTKIPGGVDPDTKWMLAQYKPPGGNQFGIRLTGLSVENVRITGCCFRLVDIIAGWGASGLIVDHCYFVSCGVGIIGDNTASPDTKASNITIEYNYGIDNGTWTPGADGVPWNWIKSDFYTHDQTITAWSRVGAYHEISPFGDQNGGGAQVVFRRNRINGAFNGYAAYNPSGDRYSTMDHDIHHNYFENIADDCIEPEQTGSNWRIWKNRYKDVAVFLSTGPLAYGPIYVAYNEGWKNGVSGVATDLGSRRGIAPALFKFSGGANPPSRIYVIHNTFWSNEAASEGSGQYAGGGGAGERFYLRNNIIRQQRYAFQAPASPRWDEDYNHFATSSVDGTKIMNYDSNNQPTVAAYRTASGQGAHTNEWGGVVKEFTDEAFVDGLLTDPTNGDLSLKSGTNQFVDAGVIVPNISDVLYVSGPLKLYHYTGAAPDLGSVERDAVGGGSERTADTSRTAATGRTARV